MILDFHPKITAQSTFYDKTLLLSSLLNGKASEKKIAVKKFYPKKLSLKTLRFFFELTVFLQTKHCCPLSKIANKSVTL